MLRFAAFISTGVARRIRRANERVRAAGGTFYQFAFSRREVTAAVERAGFRVVQATPYDPARVLRSAWRRWRPARGGVRGLARRLLYTRPALHALGHMILLVALKR